MHVTNGMILSTESPKTGEVSGSVTAKQLPDITNQFGYIKAAADNAGTVYVGGSSVTTKDGTTDTTTGYPLAAGDEMIVTQSNLDKIYIICDNAGDDIIYCCHV